MSKAINITVRYIIEEREIGAWNQMNALKSGRPPYGSAEHLLDDLKHYLTSDEAPLFEDYGEEAWGGYEGAYITHARILKSEVES